MVKAIFFFGLISVAILSCKREHTGKSADSCISTTQLPGNYTTPLGPAITYNNHHCGLLPLGKNNYWVYVDSLFDTNGDFIRLRKDTLRFPVTYQTPDGIIWWSRADMADTTIVGLDKYMYSTDSVLYTITKNFGGGGGSGIKWFYTINDLSSLSETINYSDVGSPCVAQKITGSFSVPAGTFSGCMFFRKQYTWGTAVELRTTYKGGIGMLRTEALLSNNKFASSTLLTYYIE